MIVEANSTCILYILQSGWGGK